MNRSSNPRMGLPGYQKQQLDSRHMPKLVPLMADLRLPAPASVSETSKYSLNTSSNLASFCQDKHSSPCTACYALGAELSVARATIESLSKNCFSLSKDYDDLHSKYTDILAKYSSLQNSNKPENSDHLTIEMLNTNLKREREKHNESELQLTEKLTDLSAKYEDVLEKIKSFEETSEDNVILQNEVLKCRQIIQSLKDALEEKTKLHQQDREFIDKDFKDISLKYDRLLSEYNALKSTIEGDFELENSVNENRKCIESLQQELLHERELHQKTSEILAWNNKTLSDILTHGLTDILPDKKLLFNIKKSNEFLNKLEGEIATQLCSTSEQHPRESNSEVQLQE